MVGQEKFCWLILIGGNKVGQEKFCRGNLIGQNGWV